MTRKRTSPRLLFGWIATILVAVVLRVAPLTAGKPYIAYVDEGNFLRPVVKLLREGGWDPGWYLYPQFPITAVTATLRLYSPLFTAIHGHALSEQLSPEGSGYDVLEPFDVLIAGRVLSLLAGISVVLLTGFFAYRLVGPEAGLAATLIAALTPGLAIRGAIAAVDPFATLFVLASLVLADQTRSSRRPGLSSLGAGVMAGCAFASKYPAVVVLAAFGVTTLLQPIVWREKFRRLFLAGLGVIMGAALAMPALIFHPGDVDAAITKQALAYASMPSPGLWRQAVLRAEWDLPYEHAELGLVYLTLVAAGFVFALRDPKLAPTAWGWFAFLGLCLWMYGRQAFQPFRNLLPLLPIGCISIALLFERVRRRFRRVVWVDALAIVFVIALLGIPLTGYAWERLHFADSRTEALDWLAANAREGDSMLFSSELGFVGAELARLPTEPTVLPWDEARVAIGERKPRFIVAGLLEEKGGGSVDVGVLPAVRADYAIRARFGDGPTISRYGWWSGNRRLIYLLQRLP